MKKLTVFLCIFLTMSFLCVNSYAKYIIENTSLVANINIDGEIPKIELLSVDNTNKEHKDYANETHTITIKFAVKERNIKEDYIADNMKFLLDDKQVYPKTKNIIRRETREYVYFTVTLTGITGNGKLRVIIPEGSVIDNGEQINEEAELYTGITIDNIAPVVSFTQEEIGSGIVKAKIKANERIRKVNGWQQLEESTALSKNFSCNVLYTFPVTDLAGNTTNIDVKIDKATKIKLRYGSISESPKNSWEFGTGLNEIVGKDAIKENNELKIEAISMYWEGLDNDFIQTRCFVNTYWKEGIQGTCYTYGTRYNYGYNPSENEYATLANGTKINLDGKSALLLGGTGINKEGNSGIGGEAIPMEIENQHLFGITALSIKLKDNSEHSVVYQAWVNGIGWLEPASDGEETTYNHNKPIGAYRMSLIPKTEKEYLIQGWKKDVGTNNMK